MGDAIIWWITLEVLGVAAWPIAWVAMRRLPERGWAFSKPLGLLLVGYAAWLVGMVTGLPFTRFSNGIMLLALVGFSAWLLLRNDRALAGEMGAFLRGQRRYWIFAEALFTAAYIAWAILRAYSPDIFGTEKFMDFAFLNSFTQGHVLPPQDPWFAGYSINYYYFGYTLMAGLCLLSGVDSAVGFNLANVTLVSLTMLGCFGLIYNLVAASLRARRAPEAARSGRGRAVAPARVEARAAGAALPVRRSGGGGVAVIDDDDRLPERPSGDTRARGNGTRRGANGHGPALPPPPAGASPVPWQALGAGVLGAVLVMIVGNLAGAGQVLFEHQTPDTFNWWNPSRVIHDVGAPLSGETINEFPFFSFMLNDMHPHMLALPFVVLVLGLALALLKAGAGRPTSLAAARARQLGLLAGGVENRVRLGVLAIATGALFVVNTWDYPTYLLIVLLALALPILGTPAARWAVARAASGGDGADVDGAAPEPGGGIRGLFASRLGSLVAQAAVLVALGLLLFLPFQLTFKSFAGAGGAVALPPSATQIPILGGLVQKLSGIIGLNIWPKTAQGFLVIFGFFLYAIVAWVVVLLVRDARTRRDADPGETRWLAGLAGFVGLCVLGALILQFPLLALLPPLGAVAVYGIRARLQPGQWSSEDLFALCMIGTGALITFGTEIFFLQDVFHSRFNTLFKFYYQTWVLWGLAAAFGAWWLWQWAFGRRVQVAREPAPAAAPALVGAWSIGFVVFFALAMVYPALAPAARDNGIVWLPFIQVANPAAHQLRGLDGIQFLANQSPGDLEAIRWLRANAPGDAGIAEAAYNIEYNSQGMHGRVSAYTGMPTIIAWHGHEVQWRGGQPDLLAQIDPREADEDELYATTDVSRALQIMQKYHLTYVFVGSIEKSAQGRPKGGTYSAQALAKFGQFMQVVFNQDGTTVYKLPDTVAAAPGAATPGAPNPGALPHP